jgi:hypothetical protein
MNVKERNLVIEILLSRRLRIVVKKLMIVDDSSFKWLKIKDRGN